MASNPQGYDEERFVTAIDRNFLCLICFNVLRDPVECPRNKHCFCRDCITKYLENSQRCPTCADELTVATLNEPSRIVKDYLNEQNVHCKYANRDCHEIVQLQHLDDHEATCGFSPVVCTNQGCGMTVNKRDLVHHESELCECRKLKCHSCEEMTKTLADMEKRMANVEKKLANLEEKVVRSMPNNMGKVETNIKRDMEGKLEAVNNEVGGLKAVQIEGFNEINDVPVKMEGVKEENTRQVRPEASGDKGNVIVAGGRGTNSVEIFKWHQKFWSHLQSLPKKHWGATSFVYNNHATIAGGFCPGSGRVDNMIKMSVEPNPDPSVYWSKSPVRLPAKLQNHSSVVYKDQLIITGGYDENVTDRIDKVQLVSPYTMKTLSTMPEPRQLHSSELFNEHLLIVGGRTTKRYQDNLSSVVLYDVKKNECKQLAPLPYEVSRMPSVRWGDNIIVIGGLDKHDRVLDTVISYNVTTEQYHMLPSMRYKRSGCTAVVIGNNIVVLGGVGERGSDLKSVEAFNFDRYTWEELPDMSEARYWLTAVAV